MALRDPFTPWKLWAVGIFVLMILPIACQRAQAGPRYQAVGSDGLTITLHDEDCAIDVVTNLRFRATWRQGGAELIEGCWSPSAYGVVMFYFADRTMAVAPISIFTRVSGT